jgi:hypothetical protein
VLANIGFDGPAWKGYNATLHLCQNVNGESSGGNMDKTEDFNIVSLVKILDQIGNELGARTAYFLPVPFFLKTQPK